MTPSPRSERLAFRRALMAASSKRHPRRIAPAKLPSAAMLEYSRLLRALSREMDAAIWAALKEYGIRNDDERAIPRNDIPSLVRSLRARLGRIASGNAFKRRVEQLSTRVEKLSRAEFRKQIKNAIGIDLRGDPNLVGMFDRWHDKNLALIVSLSQEKVTRVRRVLEQSGSTARVEDIAERIRAETGATESRAILIARDQTMKLHSEITEAQHRHAGVTEFIWSTSKDERVRDSHRELEGKRFSYDEPPIVDGESAIPGQPIQCRCVAIPILPESNE